MLNRRAHKHAGRSFLIYSYNLFSDNSDEALATLRVGEAIQKELPNTSSVIYLDRIGYTVDDWMKKFGEWIKDPNKRSNMEFFTGYMTPARFVIALMDYYSKLPDGEPKRALKTFLNSRVESKLVTSNALEVSKVKENVESLTNWVETNSSNPNVLTDWLSKAGTTIFDEEKFVASSKKIAEKLRGKTSKNIIVTLNSI
ncbi:MAG: hypothetical protein Nk1A_7950 [Endomicrobiia bacterium]|nr:MAG: hypothetical protein Nk1A_7950 [Endomicrobiia bacterium]